MEKQPENEKAITLREISSDDLGRVIYSKVDYLYRVCYRILLNRDESEEAVAETMFRAVTKFSTFKKEAQLETWLYRIATNVCFDFLRRKKSPISQAKNLDAFQEPDASNAESLALTRLLDEERSFALRALLSKMRPRSQLVLFLREVDGLSYEEIAARLKCALGTVKSMINRAKKEALKIIEQDEELRAILLRQKR